MPTGNEQALATLMSEYKTVRDELLATMGHTRQLLAITYTAIGVMIAGATAINSSGHYYLFLLAALFFYSLDLTFLRYMLLHAECVKHLHEKVIPRIRQILQATPELKAIQVTEILTWESDDAGKGPFRRYPRWMWLIIAAPALVPFLAALLCLFGFFVSEGLPQTCFGLFLVLLNLFIGCFCGLWGLKIGLRDEHRSPS